MTTFDYVSAWQEIAKPAFESLPANIRALVERVATECASLTQLSDLSMPWPEMDADDPKSSLRAAFDAIPAEWLAQASRIVYHVGHWHPGAPTPRLVPNDGAAWKFSHYADQSLRARLGLPERGDNGRDKARIQYQVIEGLIRVCYSSAHSWTWEEVAPATAEGYETAQHIAAELRQALDQYPERTLTHAEKRDHAASEFFKTLNNPLKTFAYWEPWTRIAEYMISEAEFQRRQAASRPPVDREKVIAGIERDRDQKIANETIEAAGKIWLVRQGLPTDNAIYYSHAGRWAFGWRQAMSPEDRETLTAALAEFPYPYDLTSPKY